MVSGYCRKFDVSSHGENMADTSAYLLLHSVFRAEQYPCSMDRRVDITVPTPLLHSHT
jgi:hypothetical protein